MGMTIQRLVLIFFFCLPLGVSATKLPTKSQRTIPLSLQGGAGRANQHCTNYESTNDKALSYENEVSQQRQQQQGGNAFLETHRSSSTSLKRVVYISAVNILLNTLRQDPSITWQMRIPRVMWELTIIIVAKATSTTGKSSMPGLYILLALILASTAVVDLFVWAPVFASFASFETCEGGFFRPRVCKTDYSIGLGRLVVVVQCMTTELFYLMSSIDAKGTFTFLRDQQKVNRHVQAMQQWEETQQGSVILRKM